MRPLPKGYAMFKNRELRIKLDKTKGTENETPVMEKLLDQDTIALIEERGKKLVTHITIAVVAAVATLKIVDTLSEIAVKKTKSADNE